MPVHDESATPVVLNPVEADRPAEFVRLAGCLAVQRKLAHTCGRTSLHLLLQPRVGNDELPVVEDEVADQPVQKPPRLRLQSRIGLQLFQRPLQSVAHLDVSAAQRSGQLLVVVASDTESDSALDHGHDKLQDSGDVGPSIDQVSQEDHAPGIGVGDPIAVIAC